MNKEQKVEQLDFLSNCFSESIVTLFADYRGLSVVEMTELRRKLKAAGANAKVVKNSLLSLAAKQVYCDSDPADMEKLQGVFSGPSLLAFAPEDVVAPAKVLTEFAKENENLVLKGGWFDGSFLDSAAVTALSKMPSREDTLAKLLSLLNTPATQLLRLMSEPGSQVARVIAAQRDKLAA